MSYSNPSHRYIQGITLIEVLVTIAITTVGLLGLSALQLQSIKSTEDSGNRAQAIWLANDIINRIWANEASSDDYITNGELRCADRPNDLVICSAHHDGTQQQNAANCSNTEAAVFDLWEVLCGSTDFQAADVRTRTGSHGYIALPGLNITQDLAGNMTITVSWDSRTEGTDADGNRSYIVTDDIDNFRSTYVTVIQP